MLTRLRIKNFKRLEDVEIELGKTVVFIGPNNSGKTTALQALALWEIGLRKWLEKRSARNGTENAAEVAINRRDLIAVPVPDSNLLWKDLHVRNVQIDVIVSGITDAREWDCGFEFDYANSESLYCRPVQPMPVPEAAASVRVAFLPPMSGMAATEDRLPQGAINVRIGEGRTSEVLRNLCYLISSAEDRNSWQAIVTQIKNLFGVTLQAPEYISERGQITMSYEEGGSTLDLASSGRGLQQTLLLLAHLYTHPAAVLLLDEPDAHLEILRQRQIYRIITEIAESLGCQVIAASHSEVLLNEAADRDVVVAFVGKPHRVDDRGSQLLKSLRAIGFDQYYQAEQKGWVLYLEGSTDLAILQEFAKLLNHRAQEVLEQPFVHYVANQPSKARDHFIGLKEAKPNLAGIAIFDSISAPLDEKGPLSELMWSRRELENYLCYDEALLAFAPAQAAMRESIDEVKAALAVLGRAASLLIDVKASDEYLGPVFQRYFGKLGLTNLMQKTDYHSLVPFVPKDKIDPEIAEKLDRIVAVSNLANPVR